MRYLAPAILWCISASAQSPVPTADSSPSVKPEDKCSVEGTVVSATTGEPLKKARLVLQTEKPAKVHRAISDGSGHCVLVGIDPGRYHFHSVRNGYLMQFYPTSKGPWPTLTLSPGQKLTEIIFRLTPQGVITGRVLDEDREPVPSAIVECLALVYANGKRQFMMQQGRAANDIGEFRIIDLKPGRYIIGAIDQIERRQGDTESGANSTSAFKEAHIRTYYPNTVRQELATYIDVTAGAQVKGIEITLAHARTARVKGRVSLGDSERSLEQSDGSLQDIDLALVPAGAGSHFALEAHGGRVEDSQGNFEISGVIPGSYVLHAEFWDKDKNKSYTARMPVEITDSNVEGLDLKFQATAEINGRVILEENGDLRGAALSVDLQARDFEFSPPTAEVKDVSFRLANVDLESYDINVRAMPEGFYVKAILLGREDVTETGLDFTQGVLPGDMTVVLNPNGGQVNGSVHNVKGEPATDATVTLIPDESHRSITWMYKTAQTDKNGHFNIKGIRPGEYTIYAWEGIEKGVCEDPDFMKPHESEGEKVSIKESTHETMQLKVIPAETTGKE
jgi:hypothetical protein